MQRTGRRGHAQFRVIVQDSRFSPAGGRVVAYLGSYNPHTKKLSVDTEKAAQYLANGAQPSDKIAGLLKAEGVKLPTWVKTGEPKKRAIRNPEKLRRNRPAQEAPAAEAQGETAAEEVQPEVSTPVESSQEAQAEPETPAETSSDEAPAVTEIAGEEAADEPKKG